MKIKYKIYTTQHNEQRTRNIYIPGSPEPFKLGHGCTEFIGLE
jgi:hypothetical protein